MARRHTSPDPELDALARDRLARLMGGGAGEPRRAAGVTDVRQEDGLPVAAAASAPGRPVGVEDLEDLEPPRRFTRWHLAVVTAVLLAGLVWGGWSWARSRPEAVAAPPLVQSAAPTDAAGSSPATSGAEPSGRGAPGADPGGGPVVHVLGAVRHPGLVRLSPGARVEDAIEAAGGLRRDADPDELNLALPLDDGVQVVIGSKSHPKGEVRTTGSGGAGSGGSAGRSGTATGSGEGSGGGPDGGTVDLNRATADQLDALPGVGPVTAQKILDWREQHGRFSRAEELQEVDGIGPKTYARLAPHVRV